MSCLRLKGASVALGLILSSHLGMAYDAGTIPTPDTATLSPAGAASSNLGASTTPALMALPVDTTPLAKDASTTRKFYTLTASLRETYDDNVNTSNSNPQSSWETELSPSILVEFPTSAGDFAARYTFMLTYYSVGPNSYDSNGKAQSQVEYTHDFVAQYGHAFSELLNLSCAEEFRSYVEPSLDQNTGTAYQNGAYLTNVFNGTLNAQWTPLFGTTTTYSNTIVSYDDSNVADSQNSVENTGSQLFLFSVLPKVSFSFGGIVDDISYDSVNRGYISYTGFLGGQWQALPSLSVTGRGGASYTQTVGAGTETSPYAALSLNWSLGSRSLLTFSYAHEITPSDQAGANGELSDRFSAGFNYAITTFLSAHLGSDFTHSVVSQGLINSGLPNNYNENIYQLDTGLTYHYNNYLDFDSGVSLSGVSSDIDFDSYTRQQFYLGVRGTY
jgi:hypothetical protein